MENPPRVGHLIPDGEVQYRDAIHVAVAPVVAGEDLDVAMCVDVENGVAVRAFVGEGVGVVDPYLMANVKKGQRFWLFLYPGTAQGLRHSWTHPAFAAKAPLTVEEIQKALQQIKSDEKPEVKNVT